MSLRQRIDLYRDDLRPREPNPEFGRHLLLIGLALLVAFLWGAVQEWRAMAAGRQLAALRAEQASLQERITEASGRLSKRLPDPALSAALVEAQQALDGRHWLLARLAEAEAGGAPLSPLLEGLGRGRPAPLWLTRMRVAEGGRALGFGGRTLDPEAVPAFLERLAAEPALAGREFTHFLMERPETAGEPMRFDLATACVALEGGCEAEDRVGARP